MRGPVYLENPRPTAFVIERKVLVGAPLGVWIIIVDHAKHNTNVAVTSQSQVMRPRTNNSFCHCASRMLQDCESLWRLSRCIKSWVLYLIFSYRAC